LYYTCSHPYSAKPGIIIYLEDRTVTVFTNEGSLKKEQASLRVTLVQNVFQPKFINCVLNSSQKLKTIRGTMVVPYFGGFRKYSNGEKFGV
jgi:hypothetical protein